MDEDANVILKLTCLVSKIKREVVGSLNSFLSLLRKYEGKKKLIICSP
jgi:hypothetical protein